MTSHSESELDRGTRQLAEMQHALNRLSDEDREAVLRIRAFFEGKPPTGPALVYISTLAAAVGLDAMANDDDLGPEFAAKAELDAMRLCVVVGGVCNLAIATFARYLTGEEAEGELVSIHELQHGTHVEWETGVRAIVMARSDESPGTPVARYDGLAGTVPQDGLGELVRVILPPLAEG